ncbi:hypothetical protein [Streptomyces sp. st77]|uniref:hypothetical protein n=1 Tax=Streptomyces sp. st77 TaxID=1828074 RepID=UPI000BFC89FA|nr:hypothetical protein [Streptomyces sp. st77]
MKKPSRLVEFFYGLFGRSYAYESADEVREVIAKNSYDALLPRIGTHTKGAAQITDSLGFQPGLVDLHGELHDTWHYLTALRGRAHDLGCDQLVVTLGLAADDVQKALASVALAAEETVPVPELPASR